MLDTTDVGRLTSPLFAQEREVSANPFSASSSSALSSVRRPMRDVIRFRALGNWFGTLSHFQVSRECCRKVKEIENWRVCKLPTWKRKELCPNRKIFMKSMKRKLIKLFKENVQLRQDFPKRRLNWTEGNRKGQMLILLCMKLADIMNPREWSSIRQVNCLTTLKGRRAC